MYEYEAQVSRVIDGDTIEVNVDLGFSIYSRQVVRLKGINAPELHGTPNTAGKAAKDYLAALLSMPIDGSAPPVPRVVRIVTFKDAKEKYGRLLADVRTYAADDGKTLSADTVNAYMVRGGHAKAWDGKGERPV